MAFNSDGYIMLDFAKVNFTKTNQIIDGLYDRVRQIVGNNKFVIVINANNKTPLPSAVSFINNQYVIESVLFSFTISSNDNIHIKKNTSVNELIDDNHASNSTTYSSNKINNLINGISIDSLSDIEDVDITSLSDGDILIYNALLNKWVTSNLNIDIPGAGYHNSICRGKFLGTTLTTEQKNSISNGTFNDMFIGDYWTINGNKYIIAHFDYWLNTGYPTITTDHHIVMITDSCLDVTNYKFSSTTGGGYYNSLIRNGDYETGAYILPTKNIIESAFGNNLFEHYDRLSHAPDNWTWTNSIVDILSSTMVYGNSKMGGGSWTTDLVNGGVSNSQLNIFRYEPSYICIGTDIWLRDIDNSGKAAIISNSGTFNKQSKSNQYQLRPVFGIKG